MHWFKIGVPVVKRRDFEGLHDLLYYPGMALTKDDLQAIGRVVEQKIQVLIRGR